MRQCPVQYPSVVWIPRVDRWLKVCFPCSPSLPCPQAVGDGTGVKPVYESLIEVKNLPFLDNSPDGLMHHVTAAEACGKPPVTFQRVERVFTLLNTLKTTTHNGFPVIATGADGESYIMGIILRSQLLVLLRTRRCFQPSAFVSEVGLKGGGGLCGSMRK